MAYFKAFIRVVKSLINDSDSSIYGSFDTVTIITERLIVANDKTEVKKILLEKYPQFFPTNKVFEKETKDNAQFFYVVIFPLYEHESEKVNSGNWICNQCGHIHENEYLSRPVISKVYPDLKFCGSDYYDGNNVINHSCLDKYKMNKYSLTELADDEFYIKSDSLNYIYKCTEKSTGKSYVGKTKNAPFWRWWNHLTKSSSPFGIYLQQTKLSEWTFEVLEELPCNLPESEILKIESKYMLQFDSIKNGFNTTISNKSVIEDKIKACQPEICFN